MINNKGQEEMVGFALIMIIVSIIIVVFIALTLTKPQTEDVQSYEVESFLQALLQQTSDCQDNFGYLSVQNLIFRCKSEEYCNDGIGTCEVLNSTLKDITGNFWDKQNGFRLVILSGDEVMLDLKEGNISSTYKGALQPLGREDMQLSFRVYS